MAGMDVAGVLAMAAVGVTGVLATTGVGIAGVLAMAGVGGVSARGGVRGVVVRMLRMRLMSVRSVPSVLVTVMSGRRTIVIVYCRVPCHVSDVPCAVR
ncbi:MAG TPA: hypothetical protein VFZ69_00555 [Longimicrobiales bacterium]